MLKREKKKAKNKSKKKKIENEIYKTEELLIRTRRNLKSEKERNAIEAMNKNPKIFYSIYNRRKNRKNELGPLKENDKFIIVFPNDHDNFFYVFTALCYLIILLPDD